MVQGKLPFFLDVRFWSSKVRSSLVQWFAIALFGSAMLLIFSAVHELFHTKMVVEAVRNADTSKSDIKLRYVYGTSMALLIGGILLTLLAAYQAYLIVRALKDRLCPTPVINFASHPASI